MKKLFCAFALCLSMFMLGGCSSSNLQLAQDNLSEVTRVYFAGMCENAKASICVGKRENPYIKDGKHDAMTEFSLISLQYDGFLDMRKMAKLYINDNMTLIELELVGGVYMFDLGHALKETDSIKLSFDEQSIVLLPQSFEIDSEKAVEIGAQALSNEIDACKSGKVLKGECYLKLLNKAGDFDNVFWCFTLLDEGGAIYNIVIDVHSGQIIK